MKNNLINYKLHKILFLGMIVDPVLVLYAMSVGLSVTEIFVITSIQTAAIVLLEIPTGIISDIYGCKISMILGITAFMLSNIMYIFLPNFIGFLIGAILVALYKVLVSGSDETYLFLELKRNNAEDSYSKVNGFIDSWNYMLTGISSISVGYIYTLNQKSPFVICIVFCLISLFFAFRLENLRENDKQVTKIDEMYKQFIGTAHAGFRIVLKDKKIRWFMAYSAVVSFSLVAIMSTYQFYFVKLEVAPKYFGWIYFGLYLISSLFSKYSYKFKKHNIYHIFMVLLILLAITPIIMVIPNKLLLVIIIMPRIVIGIYPALIREFINKYLHTDRATVFSIRSLLMRGIQIVLLPGVGYMIEHFGLNHALVVLTGIITLLFVALRLSYLRLKPTDSV